ncbi:DUF6456 domain-containing protein [Brevundimonas sp.]|uniref:DUF6456 domain-containing protein n=1 Tax=Brevundimonas sp. TaxID=1871086 RepID=UPI0035B46CD3
MSRALERARRLLTGPGGWIEAAAEGYALRAGPDRRSRVVMTVDESVFRRLVEAPGLRTRRGGGWIARRAEPAGASPDPGRPGVIEGVRTIMEADGEASVRRANLAQTPVTWLARRVGPDGRPWLEPVEVAAAVRLALEAETALRGPSLTMRWDALPRAGAGGGSRAGCEPGERALAAAGAVEAALSACGPARSMVEHICVRATALQAAEQALGLRRRTGKTLLRQGLQALARHYRLA